MTKYSIEAKRDFAAQMRKQPTLAERSLWYRLCKKRTGFIFHRQSLQRGYILDFYCPRLKLGIEVDGSIHNLPSQADSDAIKEQALTDVGIKVLRFTNQDVMDFISVVMVRIETTVKALSCSAGGGRTNHDSSSSRACVSLQNSVTPRRDAWKNLRTVLNKPENLCTSSEIPEEQRLTKESAEALVDSCQKLLRSTKQRSNSLAIDNRTLAERAFDQKYRLNEWLKKRAVAASLSATEPESLVFKGMEVKKA